MNLERLKKIDWKGKLGMGLKVTADVAEFLSNAGLPYAGLVKTAAAMGANLLDYDSEQDELKLNNKMLSCLILFLDPPVTLKDINELQLELRSLQIDNSRNVERILNKQLEEMQKRYENPVPEVRTDFQNIKAQMTEGMKTIQKDSTSCLSQLSDMTQLIKQILGLVAQISYKVGF